MAFVVVVIHPTAQAGSQLVDETPRYFLEPSTAAAARKSNVEHYHASVQLLRFG
jgi:hypothetical protein